jgi:hypothetical protein
MFVLSILLNVPGVKICIFSTGKRASSNLMTEILDRLRHIEGGTERILKSNQEQENNTIHPTRARREN